MSLSKSQPDYPNGAQVEWQPLDIHRLEKFHTLEIDYDPSRGNPDEEFRLLYQARPGSEMEDGFQQIHSKSGGADEERNGRGLEPGGSQRAEAGKNPNSTEELKTIEQKAHDEGFAKGEKEGFAAGKKQVEAMTARLQTILSEIDGLWQRMVRTNEKEILGLIFRAAEKVVMGHVRGDNETVKRSILHALEIIPEPSEIGIKIHPEDYEFIEMIKEEFFEQVKGLKQVEVVPDTSVNRGGCIIETRAGNVVVDMEKRLESIKTSMMEANRIKG